MHRGRPANPYDVRHRHNGTNPARDAGVDKIELLISILASSVFSEGLLVSQLGLRRPLVREGVSHGIVVATEKRKRFFVDMA